MDDDTLLSRASEDSDDADPSKPISDDILDDEGDDLGTDEDELEGLGKDEDEEDEEGWGMD